MFDPQTRILIADDTQVMRSMITKLFRDLGFTAITAVADGEQAWDELEKVVSPVELIVSDWMMPGLAGIDLLRRVRADARFKGIPFLMITAEGERKHILEAVEAGVDSYLVKPFSAEQLRAKLEELHERIARRSRG